MTACVIPLPSRFLGISRSTLNSLKGMSHSDSKNRACHVADRDTGADASSVFSPADINSIRQSLTCRGVHSRYPEHDAKITTTAFLVEIERKHKTKNKSKDELNEGIKALNGVKIN